MSKELKRPVVTNYFEKDSLDVDFASYQSALNKYIDQIESKLKEAEEGKERMRILLQEVVDNSPHWEREIENELKKQ